MFLFVMILFLLGIGYIRGTFAVLKREISENVRLVVLCFSIPVGLDAGEETDCNQ